MGKINLNPQVARFVPIKGEKKLVKLLDNKEYQKFNTDVLGLGDISLPSKTVEALAFVLDLSGFTKFCNQVDPHLGLPDYLNSFLDWLFDETKNQFVEESYSKGKSLWADLPFLAKFMGDGVLFLWNTKDMGRAELCNTVVSLKAVCENYTKFFYPKIKKELGKPPKILRGGIARGRIFSVGNGEDYVGPCISIASRLQKLGPLTFCVSHRGFNFERDMPKKNARKFLVKSVKIRGIGDNELIYVVKKEFENLLPQDKTIFKDP